ncbi:MAG TPA: ribonuclease Y [Candidatus Krumholzibacteria bacterium]|nr:ribonuclease Y [Candidatus Krumholzibacteria bacterium]
MNPNWLWVVLGGVAAAIAGFALGIAGARRVARSGLLRAEQLAEQMAADSTRRADSIVRAASLEAENAMAAQRIELEREMLGAREDLRRRVHDADVRESALAKRLEILDRKDAGLGERSLALDAKQKVLEERLKESTQLIAEENARLERIAGVRKEDAKRMLLKNLEDEAHVDASRRAREIREEAERWAQQESRKIIALAIQRYAAEQCVETTVAVVGLASDDMKGRIIGREGRNIRAFEKETGVDVVIDDTPGAVLISSFDPVRREVARLAMEKLVQDGRIHPGRIEEIVAEVRASVDAGVRESGERALLDLGINGMAPALVDCVGRMKFRTSYGQNCLAHSLEVAYLAGVMASELNLDPKVARRAGLLHDIGKVASHEAEGSHTTVGAELARRHGEPEDVVNAIAAHHGDVPTTSLYTPIVAAADAVSGSRPGARRESIEHYVKRLAKLEEIADAFAGVEKSYAIQAGREIRVVVSGRKVDDEQAKQLAFDISRRLEKEIEYPGQIKVVVIRETRAIEYAK